MATFTTYDGRSAEDVQDVISNISPTDTYVHGIRPQKYSTYLPIPTRYSRKPADNKAVEVDPSMATLTATTMKSGNTQILTKAFSKCYPCHWTYGRAKDGIPTW